jgi:hypothetical protein
MISQPEMFNMLAQKSALGLELKGMKMSRGSVYAHIKRTYGLKGNKQSVYTQFCELVEKYKGEVE